MNEGRSLKGKQFCEVKLMSLSNKREWTVTAFVFTDISIIKILKSR